MKTKLKTKLNFVAYREEDDGPSATAVLVLMLVALLFGLLAPDPAQGQLRSPIRNLTNDTTPAAGDMLLVDKATPLASRKLTLHTLAGYLATDAYLTPSTRTITCTAPLLCAGTTSATLAADFTLSLAPFYLPLTGGTLTGNIAMGTNKITMAAPYTPASGGAPFRLLTSGSTLTGGSNQGLRTSLMGLYDTRTSADDGVALNVEVLQTSHTSTIVRTGIQCSAYTEPDNGGDTSCFLGVSSGGGPAATFYKHYGLRPTGLTDQSLSPQPALEVGSGDAGPAIIASAGVTAWGASKTNEAVEARLGSSTSIGYLAWPTDNVFDTRIAFAVGSPQSNAQPVNLKFKVLANGNISTPGTIAATGTVTGSNLSGTSSGTNTGDQTIALTGDVTGSGTGSFATTLGAAYKGWTDTGTSISTTTSTDKVGIGTSSPSALLTVSANATAPPTPPTGALIHLINADGTAPRLSLSAFASNGSVDLLRADGTNASQTAVLNGEVLGQIAGFGHDGTSITSSGRVNMQLLADANWSSGSTATAIRFGTTASGAAASRVVATIDNAGHFSCGDAAAPPTVVCTGTGTSPTAPSIDGGGSDCKFTINMPTGTGSPGSAGTCTVTFGKGYTTNKPVMVCMLVDGASAWSNEAGVRISTQSLTAPVISWTNEATGVLTGLAISSSYKISCLAAQ